ncbi:AraC family transcriptional regulator [Xylophilus sp.]|uniref:AraC family transcriptional regulator n=1 Tax=Xylophilus sp. TaxID=2653893 RepID=UPI0013B7EBEB|nr:helix-turn-helix transcriptional regulator [Xylophilus sp.]KAF1049566.1 MAG: HTH-type transcriptional regulator NimR [Xylophilus sp.]
MPQMPPAAATVPIQNVEDLRGPFYCRDEEFAAGSASPPHSHSWGHLNYAAHGTMQLDCAGARMLSPPQYGIWIPPGVVHSAWQRQAVRYRSLYVAPARCRRLPAQACSLRIGPIIRSILVDFAARGVREPQTVADRRLAQVVVDQLAGTPPEHSYLPAAGTPALAAVLDALAARPGDARTLAQWAEAVHTTERTLARRCREELGMTLGEWRQRLRYLRAVDALEAGRGVQEIAFDLGYGTASAFIAMFQRVAGMPPEQFRRTLLAGSGTGMDAIP